MCKQICAFSGHDETTWVLSKYNFALSYKYSINLHRNEKNPMSLDCSQVAGIPNVFSIQELGLLDSNQF